MTLKNHGGLLVLGCIAATGCGDARQQMAGSRPNILIAIADDQSFPHAGAYGCEWVVTPAFDRVAAEGLLFDNCYTPNAKSAPSRACLLTGRNSWQLEEAANHIGRWPEGKYPTFFEALAAEGYYAAFTGKGWAPGDPGKREGQPRRLTGEPYQTRRTTPPTPRISDIDYTANFRDFLAAKPAGKPWVFWYGSKEPHRPYAFRSGVTQGPKSTSDIAAVPRFWPDCDTVRCDMLDYAFEVEHFDRHLGAMLALLEEAGELDNTIVVVTADNGMPFPRCKGLEYEYSNHLPLAVMWKNGIRNAGRRVDAYVSFIDLAPTFLRLAGVEAEACGMAPSGREITDLLADKPVYDRSHILLGQERHDYGRPRNQGYPIRSIIRDGYLYIRNFKPELWPAGDPETGYLNTDGSPTKSAILDARRSGRDSLLWELSFGKRPAEELYRIAEDRECLHDLARDPAYGDRRERMREILLTELRAQQDPRVCGDGGVFDRYPFYKPECTDFYERYMNGEIKKYQTGWVNPSDYEVRKFD